MTGVVSIRVRPVALQPKNYPKTSQNPEKPHPVFGGAPTLILVGPHHAPPTSETRVCYSSDKIFGGGTEPDFCFFDRKVF